MLDGISDGITLGDVGMKLGVTVGGDGIKINEGAQNKEVLAVAQATIIFTSPADGICRVTLKTPGLGQLVLLAELHKMYRFF